MICLCRVSCQALLDRFSRNPSSRAELRCVCSTASGTLPKLSLSIDRYETRFTRPFQVHVVLARSARFFSARHIVGRCSRLYVLVSVVASTVRTLDAFPLGPSLGSETKRVTMYAAFTLCILPIIYRSTRAGGNTVLPAPFAWRRRSCSIKCSERFSC